MADYEIKPHDYKNVVDCGHGLELVSTLALRRQVMNLITDLLSDYHAPQFFDVLGEVQAPL